MEHSEEERGTMQALMQRLAHERIPRLLDMQERVNRGELLPEFDIEYLQECFDDAHQNRRHLLEFEEYTDIYGKVAQLYEDITSKALENERARGNKRE